MLHRFTILLPGLKDLEYGRRLERLKWLTLEELRNRSELVKSFKISKGLDCLPSHMEVVFLN